ncbi:MAG: hypothetical protein ACE5HO_19500 [bacterium]
MNFKATPTFARAIKRLKKKYRNIEKDIQYLRLILTENPAAGIPLGSNLFKIRLSSSDISKGKSGSLRVIYYLMLASELIVFLDIYAKSEKEDVPISEIKKILKGFKNDG